jgi:dTDP-4-amino-4,6-dideoxygalactose transaminase
MTASTTASATTGPVPLVDLKWQHRQVQDEVGRGIAEVLENTSFILGKQVAAFEAAFAAFQEVGHCVGVGNGTDAVELAVRAVGIGPGDEVILPANTFIATALGVARAGATPVLCDQDPVTHLIDPEDAARRVTPRTRAIYAVHLYGQLAPMEALAEIARGSVGHEILLLEDAAQCQGARRNGKRAGAFSPIAATSFFPGKNLGGYGDGGAVLSNRPELASKVRALRNYGSEVKYHHPETGFNSRLDSLQAVVLSAKLARLDAWNQLRREAAARYDQLLAGLPSVTLPVTLTGNEHAWHLYVIRVPRRDDVLKRLNDAGIGAGIHYPVPIHLQGAFKHLGHGKGDFPVAEKAAAEILTLPLYPGITALQQARVVDELGRALRA